MKSHIDISLEYKETQLDLRIPKEVSLLRLQELLGVALQKQGSKLPDKWRLELKDKNFMISDYDRLSDLPVGDGDVFQITAES